MAEGSGSGINLNPVEETLGVVKTWVEDYYNPQLGQAIAYFIPRHTTSVSFGVIEISLLTAPDTIYTTEFQHLLRISGGELSLPRGPVVPGWRSLSIQVPLVARNPDFETAARKLAGAFEAFGQVRGMRAFTRGARAAAAPVAPKVIARLRGTLVDVGLGAGFQWYEDAGNPYLTRGQRIGRVIVSGLGGASVSAVAVGVVCGASGGIPCAIIVGAGGGILWSLGFQPFIFARLGLQPARKLRPLNGP